MRAISFLRHEEEEEERSVRLRAIRDIHISFPSVVAYCVCASSSSVKYVLPAPVLPRRWQILALTWVEVSKALEALDGAKAAEKSALENMLSLKEQVSSRSRKFIIHSCTAEHI